MNIRSIFAALIILMVWALSLLSSSYAFDSASVFKCNGYIISVGFRQSEVLSKCGEPSSIQEREEMRIKRDFGSNADTFRSGRSSVAVKELVIIQEWEYNPGPGGFVRLLSFENGILVDIVTGRRGY